MSGPLLSLFATPMELTGTERMLLILPLCLCVAIVYKGIRTERVEEIPKAALQLWLTVLGGMCAVGIGLWAIFELLV